MTQASKDTSIEVLEKTLAALRSCTSPSGAIRTALSTRTRRRTGSRRRHTARAAWLGMYRMCWIV